MELADHPIFIGFKLAGSLKHHVQNLSGPDRRYVAVDDSTFLRLCTRGEHIYVGKVIEERLTTDRVDDIRRNVLSIIQRLCPDMRLPTEMSIWACAVVEPPVEQASYEG